MLKCDEHTYVSTGAVEMGAHPIYTDFSQEISYGKLSKQALRTLQLMYKGLTPQITKADRIFFYH